MVSDIHTRSVKPDGTAPAGVDRPSSPSESLGTEGQDRSNLVGVGPRAVPDFHLASANERVLMPRPPSDLPSLLGSIVWGGRTRLQRFWDNVEVGEPDACWPWLASRSHSKGYGQLGDWRNILTNTPNRPVRAHIISWAIANDRWPNEGQVVRHSCDNPPCCNPRHLLIGTHADNMRDVRDRRRNRVWAARDDRAALLQQEVVLVTQARAAILRALLRDPQPTPTEIARERGVSRQAVEQALIIMESQGMVRRQRYAVLVPLQALEGGK